MNLEPADGDETDPEDASWLMVVLCIGCGILTGVGLGYAFHLALTSAQGW